MSVHMFPVSESSVEDWKGIEDWIAARGETSVFRGQSNAIWTLQTSLERAMRQAKLNLDNGPKIEKSLVRRFKRESHQYLSHLPKKDDLPHWLALMQHHLAPTRFLDWTHSAFVAIFFAAIDQLPENTSSVFALDWNLVDKQVSKKAKALLNKDKNLQGVGRFQKMCDSTEGIFKLNSFGFSPRQSVQQGTFLVPTDICQSFEKNLRISLAKDESITVHKLLIPWNIRREIVNNLYRRNINSAVLFPGIDGYSRSLLSLLTDEQILSEEPIP